MPFCQFWVIMTLVICLWHRLFQLLTLSFNPQLKRFMGILTPESWCALSSAFHRKKCSSLPLVEQWKEYVTSNHLKFPAREQEKFLTGRRVKVALHQVVSYRPWYPLLRGKSCHFVLSTVASRSLFGQETSSFCPKIVIVGDDWSLFKLFNKLLGGLLERG